MTISQIRAALVKRFGARQYRIAGDGSIHACGVIPNTDSTGWYLFAHVSDADLADRLA